MAMATGFKAKSQGALIALRKAQRAREIMCAFARVSNPKKNS